MERHDTHNISCSSSEEHSYKLENYQTTKNISSENKFYIKEEEKNEWSKIISNKNIGDNESYNINDIIQNSENKEANKEDFKKKNNNNKNERKLKSKSNSPDNKTKGNEQKKKKKYNKYTKLNNGIVVKKINQINYKFPDIINKSNLNGNNNTNMNRDNKINENDNNINENNNINDSNININKENTINKKNNNIIEYNNMNINKENNNNKKNNINNNINDNNININKENTINENNINENNINNNMNSNNSNNSNNFNNKIIYIKKTNRCFMTKSCVYKKRKKSITKIKNNFFKKKTYSNMQSSSLGNYTRLSGNKRQSSSSTIGSNLKRQKVKSKTMLANRNNKTNLEKYEEKISSLSTITAKKLSVYNNSNLYFNSSNKNNIIKKRPQSSYNIIKKEIDFNLKSSKNDNSFYNKSFTIQKTCQLSSIISINNNLNNNRNKKEIIYENKYFLDNLKELKNAFELSAHNSKTTKNIFSEKKNKNIELEINNKNKEHLLIKSRKLNSAKIRGKSYNMFYPKDPTPLFVELNNKETIRNDIKKIDNNICTKCGYKKHFGNEKNCPICVSVKEKNKLREKKLSNLNYYFPFKDKNNTTTSIQNSFRSINNSINNNKTKCINYDNFINYVNTRKDNYMLDFYYNPFNFTRVSTTLNKKRKVKDKTKVDNIKQIRNDQNIIYHKYDALKEYLE